jgi:ATP-dependent Lhr-like helicase
MQRVYEAVAVPPFLDERAINLLAEARTTFDRLGLRHSRVTRHDGQLLLFPWVGERRQQALLLSLVRAELEPTPLGLAVAVAASREDALRNTLSDIANSAPPDALELAEFVEQNVIEKFDPYLGRELLTLAFAHQHIDVESLPAVAAQLLVDLQQ